MFAKDDVAFGGQSGNRGIVGLEAGAEDHRVFLAHELRQLFFKLNVDGQSAVQKSRTAASRSIFANCRSSSFFTRGSQVRSR